MILTLLIAIVIIVVVYKIVRDRKNKTEPLIELRDIPHHSRKHIAKNELKENFIDAMFHHDYMDVITSFHNLSPSQRQIFNINNIPCKVLHDVDVDVVSDIINEFINTLNDDINKNVACTRDANTGWDEQLPEKLCESGWEKVQRQLGLPTSLYNKPSVHTTVRLVRFYDIVRYETENEIKYTYTLVILKDNVNDKLVVHMAIVRPKCVSQKSSNIIIESINVCGYLTQVYGEIEQSPLGDEYNFDMLEKNNMLTGKTILKELMHKYDTRRKVMQERIDGMDADTQDKYRETPSPSEYDTYKVTQTIFDDVNNKKIFD